jgi:flagellar assembly protein FliH
LPVVVEMNSSSKKIIKGSQATAYSMPYLEGFLGAGKVLSRPSLRSPEAIEREAFEKGFSSGETAGFALGKQKADLLVNRLEKILKEFKSLRDKMLAELEPQAILLSIDLARKILKEELSLHPEIIEKMVKEALNKICKTGPVTIRVNQTLFDLLGKKKEEFQEICPDLIFELDSQVSEEGAVVCCLSEEVQTDLNFQLSNIIEELRINIGNA